MKKITRCQFTFEDEAYIIKRRAELENFGKNDAEIARMIAKEKRWKPGTIISKIQRFIKEGKLSENNHKKERRDFSFEDVSVIMKRRNALLEQGMNDWQAGEKIAKELKRKSRSVHSLILRLRRDGKLTENPHRLNFLSENEIQSLKIRWHELAEQGMVDNRISKVISSEKQWKAGTVINIIKRLRQKGELPENPNKRIKNTKIGQNEMNFILHKRLELTLKGLNDGQIAKIIAAEKGLCTDTVCGAIERLIETCQISENPNKQKRFSARDIAFVKLRWMQISKEDKPDSEIAGKIAEEKAWKKNSVLALVRRLQRREELPLNKNKIDANRHWTHEELEFVIKRWCELVKQNITDRRIAKIIASETERGDRSVYKKIHSMQNNGELDKNPNMQKNWTIIELETAASIWHKLASVGFNDNQISKEIAKKLSCTSRIALGIIYRMRQRCEIPDNQNKRITRAHDPKQETENRQLVGLSQAADAMEKFGDVG